MGLDQLLCDGSNKEHVEMDAARFEHDCTNPGCCTFVGRTLHADVYTTRSGGLILREGSEGPDYRSYPTMAMARLVAEHSPEVYHAVQLAEKALSG